MVFDRGSRLLPFIVHALQNSIRKSRFNKCVRELVLESSSNKTFENINTKAPLICYQSFSFDILLSTKYLYVHSCSAQL